MKAIKAVSPKVTAEEINKMMNPIAYEVRESEGFASEIVMVTPFEHEAIACIHRSDAEICRLTTFAHKEDGSNDVLDCVTYFKHSLAERSVAHAEGK